MIPMQYVQIGALPKVSRFILGSNPFSGFSHQGASRDDEMRHYYKAETIKRTLREAESLGINTIIARTDNHMMRLLMEYWDEGGTLQWLAQTCPEVADHLACVKRAAGGGAKACYIHGGVMDNLLASKRLHEIPPVIDEIRSRGMLAGVAGHDPSVFEWAEDNLDVDFYMCSYYNPIRRDKSPEYSAGSVESYQPEDRRAMTELIRKLKRPVIHYKVLAAGRNDPREAFQCVARSMRPGDAVCVGVYTREKPDMLRENVAIFLEAVAC